MVALRKTPNYELRVQEKAEEAESVREDLGLAIAELETQQDDNRALQEDVDRWGTITSSSSYSSRFSWISRF